MLVVSLILHPCSIRFGGDCATPPFWDLDAHTLSSYNAHHLSRSFRIRASCVLRSFLSVNLTVSSVSQILDSSEWLGHLQCVYSFRSSGFSCAAKVIPGVCLMRLLGLGPWLELAGIFKWTVTRKAGYCYWSEAWSNQLCRWEEWVQGGLMTTRMTCRLKLEAGRSKVYQTTSRMKELNKK